MVPRNTALVVQLHPSKLLYDLAPPALLFLLLLRAFPTSTPSASPPLPLLLCPLPDAPAIVLIACMPSLLSWWTCRAVFRRGGGRGSIVIRRPTPFSRDNRCDLVPRTVGRPRGPWVYGVCSHAAIDAEQPLRRGLLRGEADAPGAPAPVQPMKRLAENRRPSVSRPGGLVNNVRRSGRERGPCNVAAVSRGSGESSLLKIRASVGRWAGGGGGEGLTIAGDAKAHLGRCLGCISDAWRMLDDAGSTEGMECLRSQLSGGGWKLKMGRDCDWMGGAGS